MKNIQQKIQKWFDLLERYGLVWNSTYTQQNGAHFFPFTSRMSPYEAWFRWFISLINSAVIWRLKSPSNWLTGWLAGWRKTCQSFQMFIHLFIFSMLSKIMLFPCFLKVFSFFYSVITTNGNFSHWRWLTLKGYSHRTKRNNGDVMHTI